MQNEVENILRLISHCLIKKNELLLGKDILVLQTSLLYDFNQFFNQQGKEHSDIILTETQRKQLELFQNLLTDIPKLSLTQRNVDCFSNDIDLTIFKKLIHLELKSVPINRIKHIGYLKSQLKTFICDGCANEDALCKKGKIQWAELSRFYFEFRSCNNSNVSFLSSMPWLQNLNLSHNNLQECDSIEKLDKLVVLNISFNCLNKVPPLNHNARKSLKILIIDHNYIQELQGVESLKGLEGLDVSWNWICDKFKLQPLIHLKHLKWICMHNNPFSHNEFYRMYLASSVGSTFPQFTIDRKRLNKVESGVFGSAIIHLRKMKKQSHSSNEPSSDYLSDNNKIIKAKKMLKPRECPIGETSYENPSLFSGGTQTSEINVQEKEPLSIEEGSMTKEEFNHEFRKQTNSEEVVLDVHVIPKRFGETSQSSKIDPDIISASIAQSSQEVNIENIEGHTLGEESSINVSEVKKEHIKTEISQTETGDKMSEHSSPPNGKESLLVEAIMHIPVKMRYDESQNEEDNLLKLELPPQEKISETNNEENDSNISISESKNSELSNKLITINANDFAEETNFVNEEVSVQLSNVTIEDSINQIANSEEEEIKQDSTLNQNNVTSSDLEFCDAEDTFNRTSMFEDNTIEGEITNSSDQTMVGICEKKEDIVMDSEEPAEGNEQLNETKDKEELQTSTLIETTTDSESDTNADEILWQVQKFNKSTRTFKIIFLALLDNELKERSTVNGKTLTKWSLDSVQSCVKTKTDPITIEIEFDTPIQSKQHRCYILEFADAQTLMKRIYKILESKSLSSMNQSTYKCNDCSTLFDVDTVKLKGPKVWCTVCNSAKVVEIEESLEIRKQIYKPMSHSPSQSSIVLDRANAIPGTSLTPTSTTNSCSAVSLDNSVKQDCISGVNTPRRYESDIEIISNPSQSSVEVLDDYCRPIVVTPSRKRSNEERPTVTAVPQLGTVLEVAVPVSVLTESSSSGSLTESVITAYESHNTLNKKSQTSESLPEEGSEDSLDNDNHNKQNKGNFKEVNDNHTTNDGKIDIYSYTNFKDVDHRVKVYLHHSVFSNENEELSLFVRSHLWKTGGSDFDGCVVLSTTSVYILYHGRTDFSERSCDWLSKNESYQLKDIQRVTPIVYNQGVEMKINNIVYILLLMDKTATENLLNFIKDSNIIRGKLVSKWSPKLDLALQQAVINCEHGHSIDPTVTYFTICKSVTITKDEVNEDIMRLGGLIITVGEFYLVPGDLSWLSSYTMPIIHSSQDISKLIEVTKNNANSLTLRFLDEEEAVEEIWSFTLTSAQILDIIGCIEGPWEKLFSVPLEITFKC